MVVAMPGKSSETEQLLQQAAGGDKKSPGETADAARGSAAPDGRLSK
jgi:hypothetical protein